MNNTQSRWKLLWQRLWAPMDVWLFYAILAIYVMSLFLLYSADGQDFSQLRNKTIHTVLGFALLWAIARTPPQILSNFAPPLYALGLLLLVGVHFFGITVNGAQRWLDLGVARIQPSEIIKISLPMMVAWYYQRHELHMRWYHHIGALALVIVPCFFIFKQPDLGTTILIMASGLFVVFFAGLPWKVIFAAVIGAVAALPLIWLYGMHDYQRVRVMTLLDPTKDRLGAGYHILQSQTAIGSGGVWGKGWLGGSQTHLDYIPESTTDFIFAVYGEEFGLIGNILLLAVFAFILARGLYITLRAPTLYSRTLAGALTMTLFCYTFVNMGMVIGILPVVGVPLPLVSYGGTATLSVMIMLGMMMGIGNMKQQQQYRSS